MSDEMKKYMDILVEHVDDKFKLLAEGQSVIVNRLDRHEKRFDKMDEQFMQLNAKVNVIQQDLKEMKESHNALSERVSDLELA